MKIALDLNIKITGTQMRNFWLARKWSRRLTGQFVFSANAAPRVGEYIPMDIHHNYSCGGHYEYRTFVSIQLLRVDEVYHDLVYDPEKKKAPVAQPRIVCSSSQPIHLKNLPEQKGEKWMGDVLTARLMRLGFENASVFGS